MEVEVDNQGDLLVQLAAGATPQKETWLELRQDILARLDKIAHEAFPIPNLPPPPSRVQPSEGRLLSPLPSSSPLANSSSNDANKENAPAPAVQPLEPGALPKQIEDMLIDIRERILTFNSYPPHTIQRLAELILQPRAHYKALASYLHAVDRVVQVTSGTDTYPLPPAISDMSSLSANGGAGGGGDDAKDPATAVSWGNPTSAAVGSDEALGGALLTPIPWLTRRSPESNGDSGSTPGAQIHSESTETIDGPNGVGSIETVSVSVNGVPSTGHARGVTQGELLRQEQRAGVVPVSQLTRAQEAHAKTDRQPADDDEVDESHEDEDEDETPHARGPEEIGVNDTGPQAVTTSYVGEGGLEMQDIDLEAAVGRKHEDEAHHHQQQPSTASSSSSVDEKEPAAAKDDPETPGAKREADQALEPDSAKKVKEDVELKDAEDPKAEDQKPSTADDDEDAAAKMDEDK